MESGSTRSAIEQNPSILPSDFPSQKIPPNRTNGSYTYVQNVSIRHFGHFARIDSPGILLFLSSHLSLFSSTIMGCVSSKADAPGERGLDKSDSVLGHGVYRKESLVRLFSSRTFDLKSHSQSHSLRTQGCEQGLSPRQGAGSWSVWYDQACRRPKSRTEVRVQINCQGQAVLQGGR